MRITLTLLICILVSGCGLFRKTTKHKVETLSKRELQVSDNTKESLEANQQVTISDKSLTINKSGTKSKIRGEKITIDNKGNIECQNCEVEQEKQNENKHQKDSASFSKANIEYAKKVNLKLKEIGKDTSSKVNVVSDASGKGIIYGSIALVIVVILILWYFGIKPKK